MKNNSPVNFTTTEKLEKFAKSYIEKFGNEEMLKTVHDTYMNRWHLFHTELGSLSVEFDMLQKIELYLQEKNSLGIMYHLPTRMLENTSDEGENEKWLRHTLKYETQMTNDYYIHFIFENKIDLVENTSTISLRAEKAFDDDCIEPLMEYNGIETFQESLNLYGLFFYTLMLKYQNQIDLSKVIVKEISEIDTM
jgi:hypothetical protein